MEEVVNKNREKLMEIAERNTKRDKNGRPVLAVDDIWREEGDCELKKLVENIKEYENVEFNGKTLLITDIYKTEGESVQFISTNEKVKSLNSVWIGVQL